MLPHDARQRIAKQLHDEPGVEFRTDIASVRSVFARVKDGEEKELAFDFKDLGVEFLRLALYQAVHLFRQAFVGRWPGPAWVCADKMDEGLDVYDIVFEREGKEEVARWVGEDGFVERLAVLE